MKYIRTKDGHIVDTSVYKKVVERTFNGEVVGIDLNHWGQDSDKEITYISIEDIVRQADTIEELCDEKVLVVDGQRPIIANVCNFNDFKGSSFSFSNARYYGAIWTDKGLIYAAKMNEKGKFELLNKEEEK